MKGPRFNPNLLKVPIYIAGRAIEEVKEEFGLEKVTKLASNETPVGPSPLAIEAARSMLDQAHRYPGIADRSLRRKLASYLSSDFDESNFVTGNGATDVIRMITQAFIFDGGNNITAKATFPMYNILTTTCGGTCKIVDNTSNYRFDLDTMLGQIDDDTRIVFLCSPNNPTGKIITQAEMDRFIAQVPEHVVVVIDESYCDYVTDPDCANSLNYVIENRNVIVLRSFSKGSGLANLRVGYLIGPTQLAEYVGHARLPFNTSDIALSAAAASLDDATYHTLQRKTVLAGREYLQTAFSDLDLNHIPSQANFVTIVDPPLGAVRLTELLQQRGFIVRALATFGMPNSIRVSVGSFEENRAFIQTLKSVLEMEGIIE